ncbi:MAG: ribosomal methyltransferase RrmJ/FtsJ [Alphaproteobacteria bacterium]|nr:ribosomal methyltransferase RrmJ/FtsJ [Alphaproteobacteria bacterium]
MTTDKKPPSSSSLRGRMKKVRVKTGKKRTVSSARWLERQLNDPYVKQAQESGYRARSVFKILEIDDKVKAMKPGAIVVDLGSTPGSWTQVAVERVKSLASKGRVIATDILPMEPIPGSEFLQMDFTANDAVEKLLTLLDGKKADVVLSDMAANTTGQRSVDHINTVYLVELAWDFARQVLDKDGVFIAKVFQGGTEKNLLGQFKKAFTAVKHMKPAASRKESPELYVVCTGFKGESDSEG